MLHIASLALFTQESAVSRHFLCNVYIYIYINELGRMPITKVKKSQKNRLFSGPRPKGNFPSGRGSGSPEKKVALSDEPLGGVNQKIQG